MFKHSVVLAASLTAAVGLGGCVGTRPAGSPSFPPDRASWQGLSADSAAQHARAVQTAMESPHENRAHAWTGPDASGSVTVERSWLVGDDLLCRGFHDSLTSTAGGERVRDVACWVGGAWWYLREPYPGEPVLAPVLAQARDGRAPMVETAVGLPETTAEAGIP